MKIVVVAAALLLALARTAAAQCDCVAWPGVLPADGATGVPLDAAIVSGAVSTGTLTLRDADDNEVALTEETVATHGGGLVRHQPDEPLAPNATYRVFRAGLEVSAFETGDGIDETPPTLPALGVDAWNAAIVDGCEPACLRGDRYTEASLDFEATGADYFLVAFSFDFVEVSRYGVPASSAADLANLSTITCGVAPPDVEVLWCAELFAVDLSGNSTSFQNCVQPRLCETVDPCSGPAPSCDGEGDPDAGGDPGDGDGDGAGCCDAAGDPDASVAIGLLAVALALSKRAKRLRRPWRASC